MDAQYIKGQVEDILKKYVKEEEHLNICVKIYDHTER